MIFLKHLIEEKLKIKDQFFLRKFYLRGIWNFYQSFNLSIAFLSLESKLDVSKKYLRKRNKLYLSILNKQTINEIEFKIINKYIQKDFEIINKAMNLIEKINEETSVAYGTYYLPGRVAIDSDEFPID